MEDEEIIDNVKYYYGKQLNTNSDLKTNVCTNQQEMSQSQLKLYGNIPLEIKEKYYGCGIVVPENIAGLRVVDLGCGAGLDCYLLSQIIGKGGSIVGVDMTIEQIAIAEKYLSEFQTNINSGCEMTFVCGYLEDLRKCGLTSDFDVAISNCVINLTSNKEKVFNSIYDILKEGGELYFSDMYSNSELPEEAKKDIVLWGEGLSGALVWRDLITISKSIGYATPRLVKATKIDVNEDIRREVANVQFISATYRLFKVNSGESMDPVNVRYLGEGALNFDMFNTFQPNEIRTIDGELYSIICGSRFKDLFVKDQSSEILNECIGMDINPFLYASVLPSKCGQYKCC